MLLIDLPVDLILQTLAKLATRDIHSICLANHALLDILRTNETTIYHKAAIFHQFIRNGKSLDQAIGNSKWLEGVSTWKQFCQKHFELEAHWCGQSIPPSSGLKVGRSLASGLDVHRFKVDEEEGCIISTRSSGGLYVASIDPDELLWSLPKTYVPEYAHVEWSNGFIAYTARSNFMEVWRRSTDAYDPEKYLPCQPSEQQLAVASLHPPTSPPLPDSPNLGRRGVYVPFASFQVPAIARASRFVYPDLVVASSRGRKAFIWDIPTSRLIETIDIRPHPLQPFLHQGQVTEDLETTIRYVEISSDHLFVCWDRAMVVYKRRPTDSEKATNSTGVFSISSRLAFRPTSVLGDYIHQFPVLEAPEELEDASDDANDWVDDDLVSVVVRPQRLFRGVDRFGLENSFPLFDAVHVSPDGKDLVMISSHPCWLVYVQDFARKLEDGESRSSFRTYVAHRMSVYLAFDGRRILFGGVHGVRADCRLYALTLDDLRKSTSTASESSDLSSPTLLRLKSFQYGLDLTSCMLLTNTHVWLTYQPDTTANLGWDEIPDETRLCVTFVDMTKVEDSVVYT